MGVGAGSFGVPHGDRFKDAFFECLRVPIWTISRFFVLVLVLVLSVSGTRARTRKYSIHTAKTHRVRVRVRVPFH